MNYFFTSLLTSVLPIAILIGCYWSYFPKIHFNSLNKLSLIAFILGLTLSLNLPVKQQVVLGSNVLILGVLLLFGIWILIVRWISSVYIAYLWHFLLILVAGFSWAKNPNISVISEIDVINTEFILHISAVILGLVFCIIVAAWLYVLFQQAKIQQKLTALRLLLICFSLLLLITPVMGDILLNLMKLQLVELTKVRLSFVAKTSNLLPYLNYLNSVALVILLACFSYQVYLPRKYLVISEQQPIEKRKKTAHLQNAKRLMLLGGMISGVILLSQLYWDYVASQPPRLSEAIEVKLDSKEQIHIPIEQVKDGKLHRFVWVASDGKAVRFFVINRSSKKLSLAVVFDACILCGDDGYIMENDQVVCISCGVRMFIPSIGKPGGCNPVPINNWQQTDTHIIVSRQNLEEGVNYFSTVIELEVFDPVDGSKLKNTQAEYKYNYKGNTYFFANERNLQQFREQPESFISTIKSQGEK